MRSLRHYLRTQSQGHHTIDRLEGGGIEKDRGRRSTLKRRETVIVIQTNSGTVSPATVEKLPKDEVERTVSHAIGYDLELTLTLTLN